MGLGEVSPWLLVGHLARRTHRSPAASTQRGTGVSPSVKAVNPWRPRPFRDRAVPLDSLPERPDGRTERVQRALGSVGWLAGVDLVHGPVDPLGQDQLDGVGGLLDDDVELGPIGLPRLL